MAFKNLKHFISILESEGELIRIKEFIDPVLEITEIADRVSKSPGGGKALLFENTGTDFPLLINAFGSEKRINLALGTKNLDEIGQELDSLFKKMTGPKKGLLEKIKLLPELAKIGAYMPMLTKSSAPSQEVVHTEPDLDILPVLKCWPADGGKFITFPLVISKDPHTGIRNMGMYRMQVIDRQTTGMHWHKHKVGARHYNEYKKLGQKMPIAVALGGDPAITYSATAPLPDNVDELMLTGFLRKEKVKLVKAKTQDIEVPAEADFIIEGYVDPQEELFLEGPFGDHTGFYSLADYYPKFHVTCITHRKDAVYPTTIVGIPPQEDAWLGKATERIFLAPIRLTMLPELIDMDLPYYGVAHNLCLVNINKDFAGHALKVMNALWGAGQMMFNKSLVVLDKHIDIHDYKQVADAFLEHTDCITDIHFSMGPLDVLDHAASKFAFGSKICIDATKKYDEEKNDRLFVQNINHDIDFEQIKNDFPFIVELKTIHSNQHGAIAFMSINKKDETKVLDLAADLVKSGKLNGVKLLALFDAEVMILDVPSSVWILTNNIDPRRDCIIQGVENQTACLIVDGTRKTSKSDRFTRDWPNVVVSDKTTIARIDEIWEKLNLGTFIKSPSIAYQNLIGPDGAVFKKAEA